MFKVSKRVSDLSFWFYFLFGINGINESILHFTIFSVGNSFRDMYFSKWKFSNFLFTEVLILEFK